MALTFDSPKNLTTDTANNIAPFFVKTPYMCEEPDEQLYHYFLQETSLQATDKSTKIELGNYDDIKWASLQHSLSVRAVSKVGVKNFPQIGALGFYVDKYTNLTYILAPVHVKTETYNPPAITLTQETYDLHLVITPPADITYTCYRVTLRSDYFANEYILYDVDVLIPLPSVIGDYIVYVEGYNEDTGILSSWSNVISLSIASGKATWEPAALVVPMSLADLADVSIADLLNAQSLRYNSVTGKWENANTGDVLIVSLPVAGWTGSAAPYTQTVSLSGIIASGYSYVVTPDDDSWYTYGACGIYMEDPTTDGSITFKAMTQAPAVALTVNLLKVRAS